MTKHSNTSSATLPYADAVPMMDVEKGIKKRQTKDSKPAPHASEYESKYGDYSAGTCYERPNKVPDEWNRDL